jgi:hypothetical protein
MDFSSFVEAFPEERRDSVEIFALMTQHRMLILDNFIADYGYDEFSTQTEIYQKAKSDYKLAMRFLEARECYELLPPHLR